MTSTPIPRLPVFGWRACKGGNGAMPCMLDAKRVVYTTSGRAAILLGLETLGVRAEDTVLLPTYHCPTMVAPVVHLGAKPHFYPIDEHGMPQLAWLRQQLNLKARVMVVPHFFGWPQPMAKVRAWCNENEVALLEDGAHALFGVSDDRPIGSWGDVAIGSLPKFLPTPDGGCLVLNTTAQMPRLTKPGLLAQIKTVVDVADVGAQQGHILGLNTLVRAGMSARHRRAGKPLLQVPPVVVGAQVGSPPAKVQASGAELLIDGALAHRAPTRATVALARSLPRQRNVDNRRAVFARLLQALSGLPGLRPLKASLPDGCAPYVFALWVDHPDPGFLALRRLNMPVFRWDRLWPGVPDIEGDMGPVWGHHVVQLACHQDLSDEDVQRLVDAVVAQWSDPELAA